MALPSSGPISLGQVRTELKSTGKISLNDSPVRKLANKLSGVIKMSDLRGKSAMEASSQLTYEPANYWNDGMRTKETTNIAEFSSNIIPKDTIIIAFKYDMCLSHEFNKSGSDSIYGGEWLGNPSIVQCIEFYRNQNNNIRNAVMPSGNIDTSSIEKIKSTCDFYIEVNKSKLSENYFLVWNRYYEDERKVRGTNLNYYVKIVNNKIHFKEEYEFSKYKSDRHNLRLNRKYKYVVCTY